MSRNQIISFPNTNSSTFFPYAGTLSMRPFVIISVLLKANRNSYRFLNNKYTPTNHQTTVKK